MLETEAKIIEYLAQHRAEYNKGNRLEQGVKKIFIPSTNTKAWRNLVKIGAVAMYRRPHLGGEYYFLNA